MGHTVYSQELCLLQKEFLLHFALFAHVLISLSTVAKFIKVYFCTFANKILVFANKIFAEYSSVKYVY